MNALTNAEAGALTLALVALATAAVDGSDDACTASESNLVELFESLSDVPLTERQVELIETIGTASAALTTGLGAALASRRGGDVEEVLRLTAQAVVHLGDGRQGQSEGRAA